MRSIHWAGGEGGAGGFISIHVHTFGGQAHGNTFSSRPSIQRRACKSCLIRPSGFNLPMGTSLLGGTLTKSDCV